MAAVGVTVESIEVPASTSSQYNTANAFVIGESDWGPVGQAIKTSALSNAASAIGTPSGSGNPNSSRTATDANLFDAANTFYQEDGQASPNVYFSRVVGPTPVNATLALGPSAALTLTAQYPGVGGNGILAAIQNSTSTYTLTLYDTLGNVLAASPSLSTLAAGVAWAATTGLVTAVLSGSTLPATAAATALSGGTDNRGSATITSYQTALTAFSATLGPGQVFVPNTTNTTLSGIWSAIGTHAQAFNRVAICDMDDNQSVSALISDLASFGTSGVASYCGFWAGSRLIPGTTPGTTRTISPSAVIAALCARVDVSGNPNQAAAGVDYPLAYATSPASIVSGAPYDTYSLADLATLNGAGINTFQTANGLPCNYGFVSSELSSQDVTYWQFNHARLRMYIVAQAQILGQPFVFSQIDGQGSQAVAFKNVLQGLLQNLYAAGALYGATASQAFKVDTGSDVNTPATIAAGQLNAVLTVSFSYFAQNVNIQVQVTPITAIL